MGLSLFPSVCRDLACQRKISSSLATPGAVWAEHPAAFPTGKTGAITQWGLVGGPLSVGDLPKCRNVKAGTALTEPLSSSSEKITYSSMESREKTGESEVLHFLACRERINDQNSQWTVLPVHQ